MLDWGSGWLDQLSAGQLALVFCAFFVGITWLGILVVHPLMRRPLHRNEPSNELIIHIAGTFGNGVYYPVGKAINFNAYKGEGEWVGRAFLDLRSVRSLDPELVTVMARADSHIQDLADLAGRGSMWAARYRHPGDLGRHRRGAQLA